MTHSAAASARTKISVDASSPSSSSASSASASLSPLSSAASTPMSAAPTPVSRAIPLLSSDEQLLDDVSVRFLYQPHTVLSFLLVLCLLLYFAFHPSTAEAADGSQASLVTNLKLAALVCSLFLLLLGLLVFPSGPFVRPHPLLWRLSFGLGVVYELSLILLLFQTKDDARRGLQLLFPYLGRPLEERTYAEHCELSLANVYSALDIFAVGHLLGWLIKSVMLRDSLLCWLLSVQWELIELLFRHWLPNFAECWWDSWLLDVLLTNGLGIYLGQLLCERLEMRAYKWTRLQDIPSLLGKLQRGLLQFTPHDWTVVRWESTSTINRFLAVNIVLLALNVAELNAFFLKALLWIPPPCPLNFARLLVWALLGPSAIRQVFVYMRGGVHSIGLFTFLGCCILATELLLIVKMGKGEFTAPMPHRVRLGLYVGLALYALVILVVCFRIGRRRGDAQHLSGLQRQHSLTREKTL